MGSSNMIIPKKNGTVCFISVFRGPKKGWNIIQFLILKIQDLLLKLDVFIKATSFDLIWNIIILN